MQSDTKLKSIVIAVNWNRLDLIRQLLDALKKQTNRDFGIIVVDNGSNDGSRDYLMREAQESTNSDIPIWTMLLKENMGFALPNNLGMTFAADFLAFDYFVLLNNDIVPDDNFIEKIYEKAESYLEGSDRHNLDTEKKLFPFLSKKSQWKIGSFAPLIENYYARGLIDSAGIKIYPDGNAINRGIGEKEYKFHREKEVFGPSGSAVLHLKKALLDIALPPDKVAILYSADPRLADPPLVAARKEKVWKVEIKPKNHSGNFNGIFLPIKEIFSSRYFAYHEDVDLAWRLRLRAWGTVFVPDIKLLHYHSATGKAYSPFKSFHVHRNQFYNIVRDFPSYYFAVGFLNAIKRYVYLLKSIRQKKGAAAEMAAKTSKISILWITIKGWGSLVKNLPGLLKERYQIQATRLITVDEFQRLIGSSRFLASMEKMIFEVPSFLREQKKADARDKDREF